MKIKAKRSGFSLGEILVAVAIMAVIAAVVIPAVGGQLKSGDEGRVESDLVSIRGAAEQFLADVRRYPATVGQLFAKPAITDTGMVSGVYSLSQTNRWRGPYLIKDSAGTVATGFNATIQGQFQALTYTGTQRFLTFQMFSFDSLSTYNIDLRMDDGNVGTGQVRWLSSNSGTLRYYAIPIQ